MSSEKNEHANMTNVELDALNQFHIDVEKRFSDVLPPKLQEFHLKNCKVLPDRVNILDNLPRHGVCAEIGTQTGVFAKEILKRMQPKKMHIVDISFTVFENDYFKPFVDEGSVQLHEGDSSTILKSFPDEYFDMIYIDGDHSYEGITKDLKEAINKIKKNGYIVCNDYTIFSACELITYGTCRAINEAVIEHNLELVYFALHTYGYHDVALRFI